MTRSDLPSLVPAARPGHSATLSTLDLSARWRGVDGIFGGHAFAVIADGAAGATPRQRVAGLMLCFSGAVEAGEATLQMTPVHAGRRTTSLRTELWQDQRLRVHGVTEHSVAGGEHVHRRSVELPDRTRGQRLPVYQSELPCLDRLEVVFGELPGLTGTTSAWVRFREPPGSVGVNTTEGVLVTLLDVMPPGLFAAEPKPWFVPTLSFSAHFGQIDDLDVGDWMFVTHSTAWATSSLCVDESSVWDQAGQLRAQSRQVRSVRW